MRAANGRRDSRLVAINWGASVRDYSLVLVDYQPDFDGYSLVLVDYDPFAADGVAQQSQKIDQTTGKTDFCISDPAQCLEVTPQ